MKYFKLFLVLIAFGSLIIFSNCGGGGDGGGNPAGDQASKLTDGTWTLTSVTDPQNASEALWDVLTVTFTGDAGGGGFTTNSSTLARDNATSVWPASGTWTFDGNNTTRIVRNDGVTMTINSLTASALTLSFTISGADPATAAATAGVDGSWVFQFSN